MKRTELMKQNTLIAEFMGEEIGHEYMVLREKDSGFPPQGAVWTMPLYHKSWDWLMPVVGKLGEWFWLDCEGYGSFELRYLMEETITHHLRHANVGLVWECVVAAIKHYNEAK